MRLVGGRTAGVSDGVEVVGLGLARPRIASAHVPSSVASVIASRSRISAVSPGGDRERRSAGLPWCRVRRGLTVGAPWTTWSPIPSFGKGEAFGAPNRRSVLVSLSQNRTSGVAVVGQHEPPEVWCVAHEPAASRR